MWILKPRRLRKAVRAMLEWGRFNREVSHRPSIFYLAYGSNLSLERMMGRCPDAQVVGTTKIPGYRLLFKKSGSGFYATIEQDANCFVPALAYKISEYGAPEPVRRVSEILLQEVLPASGKDTQGWPAQRE